MSNKPESTIPELSNLDPTPSTTAAPAAPAAPPKPSRPMSVMEQNKVTLKEAFPNVDENVIEAVLIASSGNIEPAFNALLGMTDPTYKPEATDAVPHHGASAEPAFPTSTPMTQLEQDEQLARQLAGEGRQRRQNRQSASRDRQQYSNQQQPGQAKEHSFMDDDLPIIRDNLKKGWSTFLGKVKSKLDGEPEPPAQPPRPTEYNYNQQSSRYDADPRVLGDDFSHLNVQDSNNRGAPKPSSHRPLANPNLFKTARYTSNEAEEVPPPKPPRRTENTTPPAQGTGPSPSKKWEPLRPAEDRDPFAVGDSDDEEREDLYGTALADTNKVPVETQETGVVTSTPLDPAVSETTPKTS